MTDSSSEFELAVRARAGDRDALAMLTDRVRTQLFAAAYAELRQYDDAHDAVASALLQICLHIHQLREPATARYWMLRVVRNEARMLRRGPRGWRAGLDEVEDIGDSGRDGVADVVLALDIERALRRLPDAESEAVRQFYLAGLSVREIAESTGRSVGTIKSRLHYGRRRLAQEMEGYDVVEAIERPAKPMLTAAILQTDLGPALLLEVQSALGAAAYAATVVDPVRLNEPTTALAPYDLLVLDEKVGDRTAFELLLHFRGEPALRSKPAIVLVSELTDDFAAVAYFNVGVDRLASKRDPLNFAGVGWSSFDAAAREAVFAAQAAAERWSENLVSTEHLLLGVLAQPDCTACRVFVDALGVPAETVAAYTESRLTPGAGPSDDQKQLSSRARRAIDLARHESIRMRSDVVGTEHLLIGLIHERGGMAAQVLSTFGLDLERARASVGKMTGS